MPPWISTSVFDKATWASGTSCRSELTNLGISLCAAHALDGKLAPRPIFEHGVPFRRPVAAWPSRGQRRGVPNARRAKRFGKHAGLRPLLAAPGPRHNVPLLDGGHPLPRRAPLTPQVRCNLRWLVGALAAQHVFAPSTKMYVKTRGSPLSGIRCHHKRADFGAQIGNTQAKTKWPERRHRPLTRSLELDAGSGHKVRSSGVCSVGDTRQSFHEKC